MAWRSTLLWLLLIGGAIVITYQLSDAVDIVDTHCTVEQDPMCPEPYFSTSYWIARTKFRKAVAKVPNAILEKHLVLVDPGTDLELTIETAVIPGRGDKLLVVTSGVHGAEGFLGSAVQLALLDRLHQDVVPAADSRPTILMIHAANPYGFAFHRRMNEHNVDLNRNALSEQQFAEVLADQDRRDSFELLRYLTEFDPTLGIPTVWSIILHVGRIIHAMVFHGVVKMKHCLARGQYHDAKAMPFGGQRLEKTYEIFEKVLNPFRSCRAVWVVDIHTGLGAKGAEQILALTEAGGSFADAYTKSLPSGSEVSMSCLYCTTPYGAGVVDGYQGVKVLDYSMFFDNLRFQLFDEYGTVPISAIGIAMSIEHTVNISAPRSIAHEWAGRRLLRRVFYDETVAWKNATLWKGVALLDAMIAEAMVE